MFIIMLAILLIGLQVFLCTRQTRQLGIIFTVISGFFSGFLLLILWLAFPYHPDAEDYFMGFICTIFFLLPFLIMLGIYVGEYLMEKRYNKRGEPAPWRRNKVASPSQFSSYMGYGNATTPMNPYPQTPPNPYNPYQGMPTYYFESTEYRDPSPYQTNAYHPTQFSSQGYFAPPTQSAQGYFNPPPQSNQGYFSPPQDSSAPPAYPTPWAAPPQAGSPSAQSPPRPPYWK